MKKVVHFLEKIEKEGVDIIEIIAKDFVKDIKYIIYAVIGIIVGYIVIRIVQFALWLHAYLKADNLDSNSKILTTQNEQIISLLTKIADQKNTSEK